MIQKLYRVLYASNTNLISVQPLRDLERQKSTNDFFKNYKPEDTNEELKMDLAGYVGDFHRHRVDVDIKKRVAITEKELIKIMVKDDRMKEIALTFREVDPDRNGFLTQQELDDIFRENYREQMHGKHLFGLIKEFRSATNKILVDYNKFKKWIYSKLLTQKKTDKDQIAGLASKRAMIEEVLGSKGSEHIESRLGRSIKSGGRLNEDLLTEVRSLYRSNS